jgi:hypothetical protein
MNENAVIIDLLNFCGFSELSKAVSASGSLEYVDTDSLNISELGHTYYQSEEGVFIYSIKLKWHLLSPAESLDDCAFIIDTIHNRIHYLIMTANNSRKQRIGYDQLHHSIMGMGDLFVTMNAKRVYEGLNAFLKQANVILSNIK